MNTLLTKPLFAVISTETDAENKARLTEILKKNAANASYPFTLKYPKSLHGKLLLATYELSYQYNQSQDIFFIDEGIDFCGKQAIFIKSNADATIADLFQKLEKDPFKGADIYGSFLANLIPAVLEYIENNPDQETLNNFDDYECTHAVYTCVYCQKLNYEADMVLGSIKPYCLECESYQSDHDDSDD